MAKTAKPASSGLVIAGVPRVNLLPPAVIEKRRRAVLTKRWAVGLLTSLVAVILVGAGAHAGLGAAQAGLQEEQDRTIRLTADLAGYADVTKALADRSQLTSYRSDALGNDLAWRPVFDAIKKQLPTGVQLQGFDLTPGANPVAEPDRAAAVGLKGTLTLWSSSPIDQDKVVDKLRKLDLTIDANAGVLEQRREDTTSYSMVVEFAADQTIYSGSYSEGAQK